MSNFEKRQLFLTCFLSTLYLSEKVRAAYEREWMMTPDEIEALEIKEVPSLIFNMVVANEMQKKLGPAEGIKEFFYTGNLYLLDVPSAYAGSGVILPIKDASRRNIRNLQVFRHARDTKPFLIGQFFNSDKSYLCQ